MEYKDYYKILGLNRDAKQEEIKPAYRKMARKFHPDVSKETGAEEKFKAASEAYEVLKDPEKRAAYDQLGANWQAGDQFQAPPGWQQRAGGSRTGGHTGFSDFFDSIFGAGFGQAGFGQGDFDLGGFGQGGFSQGGFDRDHGGFGQQPWRESMAGEDMHARIEIDLEDAFHGTTKTLTLPATQPGVAGKTLQVRIPKGVHQGGQIRLPKQGRPGRNPNQVGDLYLEVSFRPHAFYHVDGKDIMLDLPVAPWEAALGASVQIPTPAGKVDLKIPAGSSHGRKLRIKGRGIPAKVPGDMYVAITIALPPAATDANKKAYKAFADAVDFDPRAKMGV